MSERRQGGQERAVGGGEVQGSQERLRQTCIGQMQGQRGDYYHRTRDTDQGEMEGD